MEEEFYTPETGPPSGVGGWLLLFCIVLTFVVPIAHLYTIITALQMRLDRVAAVYLAVYLCLAAFSCIAGISLWLVRLNAVTAAKIFLLSEAAFALTIYGKVLIASNPGPESAQSLAADILVRPFLFAVIWYAYLTKSKRIRATYPNDYSVVTKKM